MDVPLWKQLLLWGLVGTMVVLAGFLLSPESRKKLFTLALRVAVTVLAMYFLIRNYPESLRGLFNWEQLGEDPASAAGVPPMPEFQPPHVTPVFPISSVSCVRWHGSGSCGHFTRVGNGTQPSIPPSP